MTALNAMALVSLAAPQGPQDAARAYEAGDYEAALDGFGAALEAGDLAPGALLYNLGNCAYRQGRLADAAVYYRRALLRMPRDGEVRFNLARVERQLGVDGQPGSTGQGGVAALISWSTFGERLALLGVVLTVGLCGCVGSRRRGVRLSMAVVAALGLVLGWGCIQEWSDPTLQGSVTQEEVSVFQEPHRGTPVRCSLRAGEVLTVHEASDRWLRVSHPRGEGWTPRGGVGLVR